MNLGTTETFELWTIQSNPAYPARCLQSYETLDQAEDAQKCESRPTETLREQVVRTRIGVTK